MHGIYLENDRKPVQELVRFGSLLAAKSGFNRDLVLIARKEEETHALPRLLIPD